MQNLEMLSRAAAASAKYVGQVAATGNEEARELFSILLILVISI